MSGKIGSGKSTISNYFVEKYGYRELSTSDLLKCILASKEIEINRKNLQAIGNDLIITIGGGGFMAVMLAYIPEGNYIINSIRHMEALRYMRRTYGNRFRHIFIDASIETRFKRVKKQFADIEQFKEIDNAQTEIEIDSLKNLSDYIINNDACFDNCIIQIEKICKVIS